MNTVIAALEQVAAPAVPTAVFTTLSDGIENVLAWITIWGW
jgi:hypothetical protein